mgnify:CR=1 FL=1
MSEKFGRPLIAWFEPGKYLVSESGYFITQVNVLKKSGEIELNEGYKVFLKPN